MKTYVMLVVVPIEISRNWKHDVWYSMGASGGENFQLHNLNLSKIIQFISPQQK